MKGILRKGLRSATISGGVAMLLAGQPSGQAPAAPELAVDTSWPSPLPNGWSLGQVSAVAVDSRDHVWILHRPASVEATQKSAPPVVELDRQGRFLRAWGGADEQQSWFTSEHGLTVDRQGNVWVVGAGDPGGRVLEFTPEGRFITAIGGRGDEAAQAAFGRTPAQIEIDEPSSEVFVADGENSEGARRIAVFDLTTGRFKRHWGAYGDAPDARPAGPYKPEGPPSRTFSNTVHCVRRSNDGLLYVCDRAGDRVQVFTRSGTFVAEQLIAPQTLGSGSVADIGFSPDQQLLYVADGTNGRIWTLRRTSLEILGFSGGIGEEPGRFRQLHGMAVNSAGEIFTAEVAGKRIQKLTPVH